MGAVSRSGGSTKKAGQPQVELKAETPTRRSSRVVRARQDLGFVVSGFDSEDEENMKRSGDEEGEDEDIDADAGSGDPLRGFQ